MDCSVPVSRRAFVLGGASLAASAPVRAAGFAEQTARIQRELDEASKAGRAYELPPGVTRVQSLVLPSGAVLRGASSGSTIILTRGAVTARRFSQGIDIQNLSLSRDGGVRGALIDMTDVHGVALSGCILSDAEDAIRLERCSGRIEQTTIRRCARAAIFSLDSDGLVIRDNLVEQCGDNGIQIWGSTQRHDGSHIVGNRIRAIRNVSGGTGQYGNGVSIFRAGGVVCERNFIRDCAFSALRNNAGRDVSFLGNTCLDVGETAIFAEFEFRDATIRDNLVDGATSGIQMVNFADRGGRGGVCTGNVIRNIKPWRYDGGQEWGFAVGIKVEADILVARNRVENAPWVGIMAGWGNSLRNLTVENNIVADVEIGVAASVAPGAGSVNVTANEIVRARAFSLVGMEWKRVVTTDLVGGDGAVRNLIYARNQVL